MVTTMYMLEYVGSSPLGTMIKPGTRIPITETGLVLVGEVRPSQDAAGASLIALGDSTVSSGRHGHCRIWLRDAEVVIRDCGSDNGTLIDNGRASRLASSVGAPEVVSHGTELSVGRCRFRVIATQEEA